MGENFRENLLAENLATENLAENLLEPTLAVGFLVCALIVAPIGVIAASVSPGTSPSGPNNSLIDLAAAENPIENFTDFTDFTEPTDSISPSAPNNSSNSSNSRAPNGPSGGPSNTPLATLADVLSDTLFDQSIAIATSTPSGPQYYVWGLADHLVFSAAHVTTVPVILPCWAVPVTVPVTGAVEIAEASGTDETITLLLILLIIVLAAILLALMVLIRVLTRARNTSLSRGRYK